MFHRGFPRNRRFHGPHHFMRNPHMIMPMPPLPMPPPLPPSPPMPEGPPVDPAFLRHTQTHPALTWCESAIFRVHGAPPVNVPVSAISKKLSKSRRKSKEERMAKEARKLRKQERKLKLESIFIKSPTPERVPKVSKSKEKSEQPEQVTSEKETDKLSDTDSKVSKKSDNRSTTKLEKKSGRREKQTKKHRSKSSEVKLTEIINDIKLEKSPPREVERNKSPSREVELEKSPLEIKREKSPPQDTKLEKPALQIVNHEKTLHKEVKCEKSPCHDVQRHDKSPSREVKRDKSATGEVKRDKSATIEVKRDKSRSHERKRDRSQTHEGKRSSSPSRGSKCDKSPSREVKLKKSASREIVRDKSPTREAKRDKSLSHEVKLDKSASREIKRDKSPSRDTKRDKSPCRGTKRDISLSCGIKLDKSAAREIKRDKSASHEVKRDKSFERGFEKAVTKARDFSDKAADIKSEKDRKHKSEKDSKSDKKSEKHSEKKSGKKHEKKVEKDRHSDKKAEKKSNKKIDKNDEKNRFSEGRIEKSVEKKADKSSDKKLEKQPEKKVDKNSEKRHDKLLKKPRDKSMEKRADKSSEKHANKSLEKESDKSIEKKQDKSFEKKLDKSLDKKSKNSFDKRSDKSHDNKSEPRSKSKSQPKFESPKERDSRSITPVIFDSSEVPASPKIEIDVSCEIYMQDEVEEPQTPPIIEALSKADSTDKRLSIFDRSPVDDSPRLDESLLGAEMLKLNLENKLRELDAEEEEEEENSKLELDIFSEDSPKATESMRTIWSIHPDNFNVPIKLANTSLYDDDMLSPNHEQDQPKLKTDINPVIIPAKPEGTEHVINSLENLQVHYAEADDEEVEMPLTTAAKLKIPHVEWDDEFSNSSYTKLCDEIEKHKNKIQEKGQKELLKETPKKDVLNEAADGLLKEVKKEFDNEEIKAIDHVPMELDIKQEPNDGMPKESILNNEYEAFMKLLDESATTEKVPLNNSRSRSPSNSSNSSSRSSSSSSSTSSSSTSSSSSSSSSNSSDSSSSNSSGSSSSSASESLPQFEENDVLKRAFDKIMEIIPENYDGGDRSGFNPEDLKNEILKILQSDANLNKKMKNIETENESPKEEPAKLGPIVLEPAQSKIWNISTDSDEILTASPIKKLPEPKCSERTSTNSSGSDRKSRKSSDYRDKRSSSREKYRKGRSRNRSRDYYDDRRNSSRNRSKSPRRRKSRSPVVKLRTRMSSPLESRTSPKPSKWADNIAYLEDSSYISNYGFRPPSPKEPAHPEQDFQYPEISSSSWNSDPSIQYCGYPSTNPDSSPQRISLDERIDMALGISNNEPHHSTYYNYQSEGYPTHNEAYNTPIYNQYYHQYKAVPSTMTAYPVPPPSVHHNYYPPNYAAQAHPQPTPISVVQQSSPFLHRNISTPPIHHQPSPQASQKASFAVQVGNVLEIIPSELPTPSVEISKPTTEKPIPHVAPQPQTKSEPKTAEQIISDAVDLRKQQRDQKRFTKKLRKEKLKLEISKLINLSNTMKIAENIAAGVDAESDSNEVSTTVEISSVPFELLGKPERGILRQGEKTCSITRKKVMFHDGIEPGNGTSTTDDEKIPLEKIKKKKKRRYNNNKENIALINQLLGTSRETSMNPEKPPSPQAADVEEYEDNLPPPPPPSGSPPPNYMQPKLKNPAAPEYLYFHLNPNENRLILTPYRPQIFHMQNRFAQLQQLLPLSNQRSSEGSAQPQKTTTSLPFNIPSRLDGLLNDPRFASAINALSNSIPLLRLPIVNEPKTDSKPSTPPTPGGLGRDETTKKSGTRTSLQ